MDIGKSTDYILSFQAKGIPFLMSDLFARGYDGVDVLDIWKDGVWSEYFPIEACKRYGQAGLVLFGDASKFQDHMQQLEQAQVSCEQQAQELLRNTAFSQADLSRLFEAWLNFLRLYFCIGIEYTELAAQQSENSTISTNLKKLQEIKNPVREYLNKSYINEDSHLSVLLKRVGERFHLTTEELWQYTLAEVLNVFEQNRVASETIKARTHTAIIQAEHGVLSYAWGKEALDVLKTFEKVDVDEGTTLSGNVANKHPTAIRGLVSIINVDYQDFSGMNAKMAAMPAGAILIAQTTAPELMVACKKAAAIVTDLGGLMSHAAIVSRELNIPCLVGTRHATKTFKDGDLVEVDTQAGTIRRVT